MDTVENIRVILICLIAIGCFGYLAISNREYKRRGYYPKDKKFVIAMRSFFGILSIIWIIALFEFVR